MNNLEWIASYGGPLIAMESNLQEDWGGIFRLTVEMSGVENDYDRPPARLKYIQTIPLQHGQALIFGEGPLQTTFWQYATGRVFILRAIYWEPDFEVDSFLRNLDQEIFDTASEVLHFDISTNMLIIFDSSDDGQHADKEFIQTYIEAGRYKIVTIKYDPDDLTSVVLHRFDRLK